MISTSNLILDGHHGHRLGPGPGSGTGSPHHMTFMDPYLRSKLPTSLPDFMRPFPKPNPISSRLSNQRPSPAESPRKEYSNVPAPVSAQSAPSSGPVNLTPIKLEGTNISENHISSSNINIQVPHLTSGYTPRIFPPPGFPYPSLQNPYSNIFSDSYSSIMNHHSYLNSTPLSPLETQYSPSEKSMGNSNSPNVFLQNSGNFANSNPSLVAFPSVSVPPSQGVKSNQSLLREKRPFKIPSLKESGGKQKMQSFSKNCSKRAMLMPSNNNGTNNNNNNNNNLLPPNFTKGSLIQLANGDLRKVEDVTTEELVSSAERCPAFRLDPSTVVRILENSHGTVLLTLSYGENKKTIEMESALEHPYFVYGQGWASCSPEKTMNCYGLQCHRLQVGDICISLSPRPTQDSEEKNYNRKPS